MKKVLLLAVIIIGSTIYGMNALANTPDVPDNHTDEVGVIIPVHGPRRSPARNVKAVLSEYDMGTATIYFNTSLKDVRVELYEDGMLVDVVEQATVNAGGMLTLFYDDDLSSKSLRVYSDKTLVYSE